MSSRALKIIPKTGEVGELLPNANNVIRPPLHSSSALQWFSSKATQGKASAVADKRLPNHWAKDFLLSALVVRWTYLLLVLMVHLCTYLLPSVYPIT